VGFYPVREPDASFTQPQCYSISLRVVTHFVATWLVEVMGVDRGLFRDRLFRLKMSFFGKFGVEYGSALPRIEDNKTIGVADEDAPEEYCGQQSILPGG
jgi:hypothetical protein